MYKNAGKEVLCKDIKTNCVLNTCNKWYVCSYVFFIPKIEEKTQFQNYLMTWNTTSENKIAFK